MSPNDRTHQASRMIAAEPARVFQAFTDPAKWPRWLPPQGMSDEIERFELRPGGTYRMRLIYDRLNAGAKSADNADVIEGTFLEIVPGRRLVQKVVFASEDPAFSGEMTIIWEVERKGDASLVTMRAETVPAGIGEAIAGMSSSLDNLARFLEQSA